MEYPYDSIPENSASETPDNASMDDIDEFKEKILAEYKRLSKQDRFKFRCGKDVKCFNDCCKDTNIFLSPYDIIRMKNALNITSHEFLKRHTISPFDKNQKIPVIALKMDGEEKKCPFVREDGCSIYKDRPWACRMYPIGEASPKQDKGVDKDFYFLIEDESCYGTSEDEEWTIEEWLVDQGIGVYDKMAGYFKGVIFHDRFVKDYQLPPEKMEMLYMAFYDIDKFRRFLFESTFLDRFVVEDDLVEKIKEDDVELMKLASMWLRFSFFADETFEIKDSAKPRT